MAENELPEDDLEAAVNAALDRAEAGEEDSGQQDAGGQPRDEHGRFASKEASSEQTGPDDATTVPPSLHSEPGEPDSTEPAGLSFPEHWSEARRSLVMALPEQHRASVFEEWRRAETDLSNQQRELAGQREGLQPLLAVLEPLRAQLATQGVAPELALQGFLGAMQQLRSDPEAGLLEIAQQVGRRVAGTPSARTLLQRLSQSLGVDPAQYPGASPYGAASAEELEWLDPRAAREVATLRGQLSELQNQLSGFTQQQQQMAMAEAQRARDAFRSATNADGSPAHPHFAAVEQRMAQLIGAGAATDLPQAYEMAVWSDAQLRQQMLEQQRTADAERRDAERKASVAKAKAASAPNGRSRPGDAKPDDDRPWEVQLGEIIDRVTAGHAA